MCGITGKINLSGKAVLPDDIEKMNEAIKHRGPDDGGIYISPKKNVGLGHRRLSIIDLSPLGHQPMRYLDRYWIVFNGEIYNFQEKRDLLEKDGYIFKSKTDTEVILALYDKYGKNCLEHLRGMFAFAIYDEKENTIFCARDRVGKKPFKYYLDDKVFIFASELKAILTQKDYEKKPDYVAIHHYLTLQYCPAPLTGFKDIKKLEPAHYLFIDLKTRKVEINRYWILDYTQKLNLSEAEWKIKIMEKLEESVRLRMISDVPLGVFLSGGVDSSAIVGLMSKISDRPVKTFSIGFKEQKYNELSYAKIIADKFKTDHREFIVEAKAIEILPMLIKQYEEPYADSSAIPTYYVSKLTREHVTVALNGDGGDENFAGYGSYRYFKITLFYDKFRYFHKWVVLPIAKILSENIKSDLTHKIYHFAKILSQEPSRRFTYFMSHFDSEMKKELYTDNMKKLTVGHDSFDMLPHKISEAKVVDPLDCAMCMDLSSYIPDGLMVKVDIASMAVALEGRSPLLDHEFIELACQIPSTLKLKGLNKKKYIFKKALEGFIPDEILNRPKMGFGIPLDIWLRSDLKKYTYDNLLSERAINRGIFKREEVKKILDTHTKTTINKCYQIWNLLVLELWFQEFFDQ
ncbi:MAG: asparagine synthase (glutamine-hydrolyzing) [bacterium]|nr:asparagine synthase (glutamine-hydrolyzing) [bacterium]